MTEETIVHVVDDDEAVRGALSRLLRSVGYGIRSHATASEFLKEALPDAPGCIVLDVRMPGVNGLELQEHLNKSDVSLPLVLMSGHGDIPMSVRAMKAGAVDSLTKPFRDQDMAIRTCWTRWAAPSRSTGRAGTTRLDWSRCGRATIAFRLARCR